LIEEVFAYCSTLFEGVAHAVAFVAAVQHSEGDFQAGYDTE
jgi:hypothetical protein